VRRSEIITAVLNFCSMKSVILSKCALVMLRRVESLSKMSSSFLSMAFKCCSWRLKTSTRWSCFLLFDAICDSSPELQAEL